ncbi:MAG: hypothetical protein ACUVV3_10290 [Dehalococcoidia bacterium]
MAARTIELAKDRFSPGNGSGFIRTLTGSTMGPCDYLTLDINAYVSETGGSTDATDTGLLNALDYVQLSLNKSKSGALGDEGKVIYKLYGAAAKSDSAVYQGIISTVNRLLFKMNPVEKGDGAITKSTSEDRGLVLRLPLFKNEPVEVATEISMAATSTWTAGGTVAYTTVNISLKAHLVDEVEDMKWAQTVITGNLANAELAPVKIPDKPGYFLVGYFLECYDLSAAAYEDLIGGGLSVAGTDTRGWAQVRNDDGQIFDFCSGLQMKADEVALAGPRELYAASRLYSAVNYGLGMYGRLLTAPVEAKNLNLILFPNAVVASGDTIRIWFFYSTQKGRVVETNVTQQERVRVGAAGAVGSQQTKK